MRPKAHSYPANQHRAANVFESHFGLGILGFGLSDTYSVLQSHLGVGGGRFGLWSRLAPGTGPFAPGTRPG